MRRIVIGVISFILASLIFPDVKDRWGFVLCNQLWGKVAFTWFNNIGTFEILLIAEKFQVNYVLVCDLFTKEKDVKSEIYKNDNYKLVSVSKWLGF